MAQTIEINGQKVQFESNQQFEFGMDAKKNLYAIKKYGTGTNSTEVHILSATSINGAQPYKAFSLHTGTPLGETDENWQFLIAGNGDLYGIFINGTASGKIEVHAFSAASNYQTCILAKATGWTCPGLLNSQFLLDVNDNLWMVDKYGTGSGKTEMHGRTKSSNYQETAGDFATALSYTSPGDSFALTGTGDLVLIDRWATGSKSTEVHMLTKASNFQTFSEHLPTMLSETDANTSFFIDENLDMWMVLQNRTGSGTTELHQYMASGGYRTTGVQTGTALGETNNSYLQPGPGQAVLYSGINETGSTWLIDSGAPNLYSFLYQAQPINSVVPGPGIGVFTYPQLNYGGNHASYYQKTNIDTTPTQSVQLWQQLSETQSDLTYSSLMTEDYQYNAQNQLAKVNTFQTVFTFGAGVTSATLFAEKQVAITVDDKPYTIDNVKSAQFDVPATGKLVISTSATKLGSAAYRVQTNLMSSGQFTMVFPDAHLHHKVATLPAGSLNANRAQLQLAASVSEGDCNQVQNAMSNVAKAVTYPAGDDPTANALSQESMTHDHWQLNFANGSASYSPLTTQDSAKVLANAQPYTGSGTTGFFGDIGHFFTHTLPSAAKDVGQGIEHGAEDVGKGIVTAAKFTAHTVVATVHDIANAPEQMYNAAKTAATDLAKGDFTGALGAVGGEAMNLGKLSTGPIGAVAAGMAQSEVKKVVLATVELGEQSVSFVIDHTGVVGDVIGFMVQKIGAAVEDAIHWLLEQFGWENVTRIQGVLKGGIGSFISQVPSKIQGAQITPALNQVKNDVASKIQTLETQLGTQQYLPKGTSENDAKHRLDWFMSKFNGAGSNTPNGGGNGLAAKLEAKIGQSLGTTLEELVTNLQNSLEAAGNSPQKTPQILMSALLNSSKDLVDNGINIAEDAINIVQGMSGEILTNFQTLLQQEMDIPFLSDLFQLITKEKLTMENFGTLGCAIPMAIVDKNLFTNQSLALNTDEALKDLEVALATLQGVVGIANACGDGAFIPNAKTPSPFLVVINQFQLITDVLSSLLSGIIDVLSKTYQSVAVDLGWVVGAFHTLFSIGFYFDKNKNPRYANDFAQFVNFIVDFLSGLLDLFSLMVKDTAEDIIMNVLNTAKPFIGALLMDNPTVPRKVAACALDVGLGGAQMGTGIYAADNSK